MDQFPSGGLNQQQMIHHIKFITKHLFQPDTKIVYPQKHLQLARKQSLTIDYKQDQFSNPTIKRLDKRSNEPTFELKKRKKWLIFQDVEQFIQTVKKTKGQQHKLPSKSTNLNADNNFNKQNILEQKSITKNSSYQEQMNQTVWDKFLRHESKWIEDKKRIYQHIQSQQQDRRNSFSKSPNLKQHFRFGRAEQRQLNEVQRSIEKLRYDAEALKTKILSMQGKRRCSKEQRSGLGKRMQQNGL